MSLPHTRADRFSAFRAWLGHRESQSNCQPWIATREGVGFPTDLELIPRSAYRPDWMWMSTSGSTQRVTAGSLRWIAHSRDSLLRSSLSICAHFAVSSSDRWACVLPQFHMGGLMIAARAEVSGCGTPIWEGEWDACEVADWLECEGATLVSVVPAQLWDWVQLERRSPFSLRYVIVGADRLTPELASEARRLGWPILASYGLTETASMIACEKPESPGRLELLPHAQVERWDASQGRVWIHCQSLFEAELIFQNSGVSELRHRVPGSWQLPDRILLGTGLVPSLEILGRGSDFVKILGEGVDLAQLDLRFARLLERSGGPRQWESAFFTLLEPRRGQAIHLAWAGADSRFDPTPWVEAWNRECAGFERIVAHHRVEKLPRTELGKLKRNSLSPLA